MTQRKIALITGITGQDDSYLAELLLHKGYEVHGLIRRSSTFNTSRIDHIYNDPHDQDANLFLHYGDLADGEQTTNLIYTLQPDEIYHLGAQSHVGVSFDSPSYTGIVTGIGTTGCLKRYEEAAKSPATTRHLPVKCLAERPRLKMRKHLSFLNLRTQQRRRMRTG